MAWFPSGPGLAHGLAVEKRLCAEAGQENRRWEIAVARSWSVGRILAELRISIWSVVE